MPLSELAQHQINPQSRVGGVTYIDIMKALAVLVFAATAFIGFAPNAHAANYDWYHTLRDATDTFDYVNTIPIPSNAQWNLYGFNPSSNTPGFLSIDFLNGFAIDSGKLILTDIPQNRVWNLVSDLASINSSLSGKASASHTHNSSQITNFNSAVLGAIASSTKSYNYPTRSLNTAFQISTTSPANVSYTVDVASTLSLTGGQTGTVSLQYADDNAFTTNVQTVQSSVNGNTGTLTIGLSLTQTATAALTGLIPTGKWVRIATANTVGTPSFTFRAAQEVM